MTNTENGSAADKRADKKASAASEPTTVTTTPQTTTVVERRGVSGGVLVGAIGAALAGGLLLGGVSGALITHLAESRDGGQIRIAQLGGMPGQQGGGPHSGPQGGLPGAPGPNGPGQQHDDDSSTDAPDPTETPSTGN